MKEARSGAACVVFEGRIVVAGGGDNMYNRFNSVELYDVIAYKWSPMPNITDGKSCHSLFVVKSKLFVIGYGTNTCEVFDNNCKKFVALKSPPVEQLYLVKAVSIGNKILVYQNNTAITLCYDVDKNEWSEKPCEATKRLGSFFCVNFPRY